MKTQKGLPAIITVVMLLSCGANNLVHLTAPPARRATNIHVAVQLSPNDGEMKNEL